MAEPGTILMWAGLLADIPTGWVVCDGLNGTPNLLNRFVKQVPTASTESGGTGGQHSYSLATGQLPAHNHSVSVGTTGDHYHFIWHLPNSDGNNDSAYRSSGPGTAYLLDASGAHNHNLSLGNTGSGASIENRPLYYQVAFIMKT